MYDHTTNNWSHLNSNKRFKEALGSHTRKAFNTFTTKRRYTCNMTHNTESSAVWNLKPERWGSPLGQEKYQGEKACDKRRNNNNNLARRRIPEDRCLVTFVRITSLQVDSGKWHLQNTNQNYQPLEVCIRVLWLGMLLIISMNEQIYWWCQILRHWYVCLTLYHEICWSG